MPQHSAILRSPSHTPGLGALGTNLVSIQIDVRDGRVCLQRLGQGLETRDRSRLASSSRALPFKPWSPFKSWSLKSGEHMTFNSDIWISLIQNLANNAESDSCFQHLHIWQLSLNRDEWWNYRTSKPSKLVTVTGCRESMGKWHHDMPQHSAILRSPSHTPGLGALGTNLVAFQIDVRDGRVCLQRLGQGLETRDISRLASSSRALPFKPWSLKSGEHMTFNSGIWISLIQNLANNAESDSCLQHLHIWQLSLNRDKWWNYRTSKPSKLVTVTGCRESMGKWHHDMPQHSAILRSPSHTPGLGALGTNRVPWQIDARDGRVYLQCLGQGLETETDQGWRLHPGLYPSNRDHSNPENTWHLTQTCESLWYRT